MNRQQAEQLLGIAKPARIRQSYPMINRETPTHWRKTLKLWAKVALVIFVGGMTAGIFSALLGRLA